jgi:hypothetical protein
MWGAGEQRFRGYNSLHFSRNQACAEIYIQRRILRECGRADKRDLRAISAYDSLSVLTITLLIYFELRACSIEYAIIGFSFIMQIFLFFIVFDPLRASINARMFIYPPCFSRSMRGMQG